VFLTSSELYLKYIDAKFMLNQIGVQSVSWSDVSIANKKNNRAGVELPNSEQSYKGKVKTHNYINRQNQSTTENCENRNDPEAI
jgi:hypothetical protein